MAVLRHSLSSIQAYVLAVEKLTEKSDSLFEKLFDKLSKVKHTSYSVPTQACVAAIRRCSSAGLS